jgi:hypothetical protein
VPVQVIAPSDEHRAGKVGADLVDGPGSTAPPRRRAPTRPGRRRSRPRARASAGGRPGPRAGPLGRERSSRRRSVRRPSCRGRNAAAVANRSDRGTRPALPSAVDGSAGRPFRRAMPLLNLCRHRKAAERCGDRLVRPVSPRGGPVLRRRGPAVGPRGPPVEGRLRPAASSRLTSAARVPG